ncbi:hypothetical protein CLF_100061 [Clonorchis sinensis]|uniref:Uncharacterized protein n=1 Tax=Clonorchis sinensis TaxID=79923 RepID=G7Y2K2_CLOSI|nr:hypothetical protein CLF_100061 [Clonorchis sinensis]
MKDPVCLSSSILSTSDFSTEVSTTSHPSVIGFPLLSPRMPQQNCGGSKDFGEMNIMSETTEWSHADRRSSEQWTTNISKILPQQTHIKSVGAISPEHREHAREFMRCHHSCISSPPMHWKRTPIANEVSSKFGRKAASKSIVADYSISFGESNRQEESSPILTPKYIVTDMTTTQFGDKPTGANSTTSDQSSKACHPLETSPKNQASNESGATTSTPGSPTEETREGMQEILQASKDAE